MPQSSSGILQVVSGDGDFNDDGVTSFMRENDVQDAGVDYQVIAITGPQSSGKSTLMNALFGTSFEEMDAMSGRRQTTRGIWLARSGKLPRPATLVMDLEGSDGRERGEDDNSFERQSALFALAVADVLLVNMWAKDVGREAGAGKPLLKTIFQVNLKLFTPAPNKRRTVLLFVFRDRTRTPLPRLVETWEADLAQMWAGITKPPQYEASSCTDFFEVKYSSLPNYEEKEEDFRAESVLLRRRFTEEGEDTLVRAGEGKLPGHTLALSMARVWEAIREQRDLNLPAHKVMVANIRCAELLEEQLRALASDRAWTALADAAAAGVVPEFGARSAALLESCITGYDEEARYFEAGVRRAKREELVARARGLVRGAYDAQLLHLRARVREHAAREIAACAGREGGFAAAASRVKAEMLEEHRAGLHQAEVPDAGWDSAAEVQGAEADVDALVASATQQKARS